jgi:hypothetical protein
MQKKKKYLLAAGRQIPKITHIAGAVCFQHFTDIASNLENIIARAARYHHFTDIASNFEKI